MELLIRFSWMLLILNKGEKDQAESLCKILAGPDDSIAKMVSELYKFISIVVTDQHIYLL